MDHLAIMNPKRKLIPKILSWEKTIESRRYMMKVAPRNRIHPGDAVYFKDAGKEVTVKAEVEKVMQFEQYSENQLKDILKRYGGSWWIAFHSPLPEVFQWAKPKKYCILIFLRNPKKITPFGIDKTWYGNACARISVPHIDILRLKDSSVL